MTEHDLPVNRSAAYRIGRGMLGTVPIVIASSMVISANLTGPLFLHDQAQPQPKKPGISPAPKTTIDLGAVEHERAAVELTAVTSDATIETASAPTTYRVKTGDTVSAIAGRYGLSTASVLALNGLSWKSTIFPGQTLHLSSKAPAKAPAKSTAKPASSTGTASTHTVVRGDTLSAIASRHGVSTQALLKANGLGLTSIIYPGQKIRIPGSSGTASPVASSGSSASGGSASSSSSASSYVIKSGDTLSSIAKKHSTTVEKLLKANGLSWTSTIYAGKKLSIPGRGGSVAPASSSPAKPIASSGSVSASALDAEQRGNARTIISVGRSLGVSDYGIVIALSAAAQESSLYNLNRGDRDSVGLFQQRPSMGWGSRAKLLDTAHATRLFFGGAHNPNAGKTSGLLDVSGWSRMTVTQAAQAVQISAYPTAYAKWERSARLWLATL